MSRGNEPAVKETPAAFFPDQRDKSLREAAVSWRRNVETEGVSLLASPDVSLLRGALQEGLSPWRSSGQEFTARVGHGVHPGLRRFHVPWSTKLLANSCWAPHTTAAEACFRHCFGNKREAIMRNPHTTSREGAPAGRSSEKAHTQQWRPKYSQK